MFGGAALRGMIGEGGAHNQIFRCGLVSPVGCFLRAGAPEKQKAFPHEQLVRPAALVLEDRARRTSAYSAECGSCGSRLGPTRRQTSVRSGKKTDSQGGGAGGASPISPWRGLACLACVLADGFVCRCLRFPAPAPVVGFVIFFLCFLVLIILSWCSLRRYIRVTSWETKARDNEICRFVSAGFGFIS